MELWWRCAALEALQAYVMSQLALCTRQEGIKMQKTVASLLQPTLDAIMASPVLQVSAPEARLGLTFPWTLVTPEQWCMLQNQPGSWRRPTGDSAMQIAFSNFALWHFLWPLLEFHH